MARDCRQPKRIQHQPVPEKRVNIASKGVPHGQLSWTSCYDDNCLTHQDSKEQTGWYPKKPKNNGRSGYDTTQPPIKTLAVATKKEAIPVHRPCTLEENNAECIATLSQICENIREKAKTDPIMEDTLRLLEERIKQRLLANTREQLLKFEERGPDTEEIMGNLVHMARQNYDQGQSPKHRRTNSKEIPTKSICMMRREDGDKKFIRKVKEQLRDLSREDRIKTIKKPDLDFEEVDGKIDFRLDEEPHAGHSNLTFGEESPYDSDEPHDVARRRAQTEISHGSYPSIDDTSSEEDSDKGRHKNIDPLDDEQTLQFYGTGEPKKVPMTPRVKGDSSLLNTKDVFHKELFWAECLDDKCLWHLSPKKDSHFYPRRRDGRPIRDVYIDDQLPNWMLMYFNGISKATFGPDPSFPMSCQHDQDMNWQECRHDQCQIHYVYKTQAWREQQEQIEQEQRLRNKMSKN
ncbi:hypothetical protein CFIO01_13745 [Colletotrichum fioriniae PJ7]|uniref:Uncharacterized protein n=1 Tax=Colletotrichum fioriniae PJ7 TaxID=1445577 RepID=A0A010RDD9_9PEZI|nr:hypothetical protein CFIO01_13745 [Colletotrichum fioriniae PJ7]